MGAAATGAGGGSGGVGAGADSGGGAAAIGAGGGGGATEAGAETLLTVRSLTAGCEGLLFSQGSPPASAANPPWRPFPFWVGPLCPLPWTGGALAAPCQSTGVPQRSHQMSIARFSYLQRGQRTVLPMPNFCLVMASR